MYAHKVQLHLDSSKQQQIHKWPQCFQGVRETAVLSCANTLRANTGQFSSISGKKCSAPRLYLLTLIAPSGINRNVVFHVQSQRWRVLPALPLLPCRSTRRRPSSSSPPAGRSPPPPPLLVPCPPPLRQEWGAARAELEGPTGRMKAPAVRASPGTDESTGDILHFIAKMVQVLKRETWLWTTTVRKKLVDLEEQYFQVSQNYTYVQYFSKFTCI